MNEPNDLPYEGAGWPLLCQEAIKAIREVDTEHYIIVPGYSWQSATFWPDNNPHLHEVIDPVNKLLFGAHLYFDNAHTGTYKEPYHSSNAGDMPYRMFPFLNWLADHDAHGIFTEYGVPNTDDRWLGVLEDFLSRINNHNRIVGGTYWAGGPWWGDYALSCEPDEFMDAPQMAVLEKYGTRPPQPAPDPPSGDLMTATGTFADGTTYSISILRGGA